MLHQMASQNYNLGSYVSKIASTEASGKGHLSMFSQVHKVSSILQ